MRPRFRDRPVCCRGGSFGDGVLVLASGAGPLGRLGGGPLGGFGLQRRLRLRDLREAALTAGQLIGQPVALVVLAELRVLVLVDPLGLRQQLGDLRGQDLLLSLIRA